MKRTKVLMIVMTVWTEIGRVIDYYMYRILLLLCFTLHIDINYSQVVKTDVELTVLVSPFINETEQMLYVYQ